MASSRWANCNVACDGDHAYEEPCNVPNPKRGTAPVPDPTVEALSEAEWSSIKSVAFKSIGCNGYGGHGWRSDALRREVERILAARAAAPDALRVAVEALAAEWQEQARLNERAGHFPWAMWQNRANDLRALLKDGAVDGG